MVNRSNTKSTAEHSSACVMELLIKRREKEETNKRNSILFNKNTLQVS